MSSAAFALPDRALVLDRYRPLKPLGRGGSGSVWLARDEQTGLEVALKIVPREGKRAARAAREMEAASRLRHERCVRAYDFGGDGGHVYIAYEYVRGRTLREVLRGDDVDDATAVEIAAQVLDGLSHAHRRGIIHRDVKPSNVLVEDAPETSVRVLDFGLAQFDEADTLTAVGDVPGTLAYISPERLAGEEASERSDVWAVGVILWEALAGSHPFWGVPLPRSPRRSRPAHRRSRHGAATFRDACSPRSTARCRSTRRSALRPRGWPRSYARPSSSRSADRAPSAGGPRVPRAPRSAFARRPRRSRSGNASSPPGSRRSPRLVGGSLLPFWPPALLAALTRRRGTRDPACPSARSRARARRARVPARERRPGGRASSTASSPSAGSP